MNYIPVWSYDNYVPAHLDLGRLTEEGFACWLKDEHTVSIDPLLANAVGGIKLMVEEGQAREAWELLSRLRREHQQSRPCPQCGSHNMELVSTPRKAQNWIAALFTYSFLGYPMTAKKVYHCFDCGSEFPESTMDGPAGE